MTDLQPPALPRKRRARLTRHLREVFGLKQLRTGQESVIASVLAGRHTLAIMPTGAGKSLCYQLPALEMPGRALIVSPLIALMKDQVDKLVAADVRAVAFNSALNTSEQDETLRAIANGQADFIFTTPERLTDPAFLELVTAHRVDLLVIDEAHCISQWGHDFRPAYLEIGTALRALGVPTVLALTATANHKVVEDIQKQLGLAFDVVSLSVYRDNLHLRVIPITRESERVAKAIELVKHTPGSGIVYAATIRAATELHEALCAEGEPVGLYHGRLRAAIRHDEQDRFMQGRCRVMVATNAFGMGIDKPDIRFVVHYQLPPGLDAYYQEAGRAGRDGEVSSCTLLYFHADRRLRQFLQAGRYPTERDVNAVLQAVSDANAAGQSPSLNDLATRLPISATKVQVAVRLAKDAGVLHQDRHRRLTIDAQQWQRSTLPEWAHGYRARDEADRAALERMVFYAQTGFCRWKVLLEHFGEGSDFERCGYCDNCVRPLARRLKPLKRRASLPPRPRSAYAPGDYARVPRYGVGRVLAATAASITLEFPDGSRRDFMPQFVTPQASARR